MQIDEITLSSTVLKFVLLKRNLQKQHNIQIPVKKEL